MIKEKLPLLEMNLTVHGLACNFSCRYCGVTQMVVKNDGEIPIGENGELMLYEENQPLHVRLNRIFDWVRDNTDTPLLKILGGEIFLVENALDLIQERQHQFASIRILTNGSMIADKEIEQMKGIPNLVIQLSLDGHTIEMNGNRTRSRVIHEGLLLTLDALVKAGIPVEINMVLTKSNTKHIISYLDYLLQYDGMVTLQPFPVRWVPNLYPKDDIWALEETLENFEKYEMVLPPRAYMETLIDFMHGRKRVNRCLVPATVLGIEDDGEIKLCACGAFKDKPANVLHDPVDQSVQNLMNLAEAQKSYFYPEKEQLLSPVCKSCFTQYDIVNLYFAGRVTVEELRRIPSYRNERFLENLAKVKVQLDTVYKA